MSPEFTVITPHTVISKHLNFTWHVVCKLQSTDGCEFAVYERLCVKQVEEAILPAATSA